LVLLPAASGEALARRTDECGGWGVRLQVVFRELSWEPWLCFSWWLVAGQSIAPLAEEPQGEVDHARRTRAAAAPDRQGDRRRAVERRFRCYDTRSPGNRASTTTSPFGCSESRRSVQELYLSRESLMRPDGVLSFSRALTRTSISIHSRATVHDSIRCRHNSRISSMSCCRMADSRWMLQSARPRPKLAPG
jgi:hypothetical protein